jgi:hypothetical protein
MTKPFFSGDAKVPSTIRDSKLVPKNSVKGAYAHSTTARSFWVRLQQFSLTHVDSFFILRSLNLFHALSYHR